MAAQEGASQPPKDPFEGFEGYTSPHYTQISNEFLDKHVPLLTGAEVKVMLVLFRATIGWHQDSEQLSANKIAARTGLTRRGVQLTVRSLEEKRLILVERSANWRGEPNANIYAVRWRTHFPKGSTECTG